MAQHEAEKQALEKAIRGLADLISETADYQPCIDFAIAAVMPAEDVDPDIRGMLMDTISEIMVHRNATIAGRRKVLERLEHLKTQLQRIPN